MSFSTALTELMCFVIALLIGVGAFACFLESVFGIKNKNDELEKQELEQECKENIREVVSKYSITQKNKVIELLLDGYEIYWQAPYTVMLVEDLSLVIHHLEKENNLVEIIEINDFIIIFKKRCD